MILATDSCPLRTLPAVNIRYFILPFLFSLALLSCNQIDDPWQAYRAGDYRRAESLWRPAAEAGDAEAQNYLGLLYFMGQGVERDYRQAFDWYQRAALQNQPMAQKGLAYLYENGLGVETDKSMAYGWYQEAYGNGNQNAFPYIQVLGVNLTGNQIMFATERIRLMLRDANIPSDSEDAR